MRVLAIDTSSNVATVAVMEDELLLGEYILNHKKTHSQKIMTMIEQILSELELNVQDIDIFAAAIGPGSFTGLRIGVATVKALAHATGKPVVSVGTLEALAYNVPYAEHIIVPIMDASVYAVIAGIAIIVLYTVNMEYAAQVIAYNLCGVLVIYWICYFIIRNKY